MSKLTIATLSVFTVLMLSACSTTQEGTSSWECKSEGGIAEYSYNGGDWANIRLPRYSSGGSYKVEKKGASLVEGTTKDGTKFVCRKQ